MECFLAGVKPSDKEEVKQASGVRKWHPQAIERFEELTQVSFLSCLKQAFTSISNLFLYLHAGPA